MWKFAKSPRLRNKSPSIWLWTAELMCNMLMWWVKHWRDTRLFSLPGRQTNASPLAGLSTVNSFASILGTQSEQGEVVWRATKDAGEDEWVQNLGRRTDLFSLHSNICEAELLSGCFYFSPFYDLLSSVFNSTLHYPLTSILLSSPTSCISPR